MCNAIIQVMKSQSNSMNRLLAHLFICQHTNIVILYALKVYFQSKAHAYEWNMLTNPTVCMCSSEDSEGDQGCEDNASARQDREGLKCEGGCQKHQPSD